MSLESSIASLCNRVEAIAPHCRTGVSIASIDGTQLARAIFPNLPKTFQSSIKDLPMGAPYFGACTAAMDGNAVITSHDLATESRFDARFIQLCLAHGIRSLQSRPVCGRDGRPVGTFVMGYAEPRDARDFDAALMAFAADAVGALLQAHLDGASD
jgi:hypothetical protein